MFKKHAALKLALPLILSGLPFASQAADTAAMWRTVEPVTEQGQARSMIQAQDELQRAEPSNRGNYLFAKTSTEQKPLVVIGTPFEIMAFFAHNLKQKIESKLGGHEQIYMGIAAYTPGQPFKSTMAAHELVSASLRTMEPPAQNDQQTASHHKILASLENFIVAFRQTSRVEGSAQNPTASSPMMMVKFSYQPEAGMTPIARHAIDFRQILDHFRQSQFQQTQREETQFRQTPR